jgi:hypothetical protein
MTDLTSNDNQPPRARNDARTPDAMGQAALLLVESLLHGLVERSVITVADAVEILEVATEVKKETAAELGDDEATMERSLALLGSIHRSLSPDLPG